ncbi:MAG TPA: ABC transporter permease, partial [Candidatus Acidoferrales bacterium]|nr:ABC transporter permease [Candidatus Acidoferrales bacterium]
ALWRREMVRFVRQRSRITGAFAQPLVFWLLLGGGLNASFKPAGATAGTSYVAYFYPGTIVMVLLFTAIFSTISTVEDRKAGFLQGVLVAPIPRSAIVLGQAMGGTSLAVIQGMMFLALAPFVGIPLSLASIVSAFVVMTVVALALTSLGLIIAWRMDSTQGFHAIMNLILLPIWFLSGAFFPASGAPGPLRILMTINPLTYGMAALRRCIYLANPADVGPVPSMVPALVITLIFAAAAFAFAVNSASRA